MKRISFFYIFSVLGIIGFLFASVSYAADEKDLLALSIAAAQEAQEEVDVGQKITLDEEFAPEDFGLTGVGILPTSPFYFLKGIRRTVQSAFTFDSAAEVELKIRFSAEKLLETKEVAGAEGADPGDIKYALENFQGELQRVTDRTKDAADGLEEGKAIELSKKLMDFTVKCQKSLGKIEKALPPDLFEDIKLAKEKTSETFGGAFDLVKPEKVTEELVGVLETQKGSEFKDFKNIEVLKEIEEKVPEQAKDAIRLAQEQALVRFQGELEKLQFAKRAVFEDFVREIGGSEARQLEIITDLEAQPVSAEVREVLAGAKEEALSKTDKRLQTFAPDQQAKFLEHLAKGEIKNIRVLKELEHNVSKGVLAGITQAKERAKGGIVEKIKLGEFKEEEKQELLGQLEQFHDAKSLAVLDEIEGLIPPEKKQFFSELKQKAVVEIKRDIDRAGTASQRQVILTALAGDHPEQFGVIDRFQKEVDVPFDFGSIWEGMRRAQVERFEMRAESIKDRGRLTRLEEDFGKQKKEFKDFRQFEELFRTRRNVFDSPERAQAQIRDAEQRIAELEQLVDSLPFDVALEEGEGFDPMLEEIERLLEVAEQKLEMARASVSQQPGRAFGLANAASDIARHGIRMAQEYKSGKRIVHCPFFFPPPPNFCLNGKVVSDIDQNGCQLPPRCEFVGQCPFSPPLPFNFCSHGKIVYEKSPQGCPLPPRCEEFRECPVVDPKPCPDGSYRDGYYKNGCFVYGECRTAERQLNCGGFAGLKCPNGYRCEMPTPPYPDATGKCIPTDDRPITCQAYWQGFVYRPEINSCVQEGTSGCSDPFVFHTKDECEKANKLTICPAMPTVDSCPAGQKKVVTFSSLQCGTYYGCESEKPTGKPACADGIDNDNDGMIDYPADTGCYGADDSTETPYMGGSCLSYTTQTSCQTSGCTWYFKETHADGPHCDDAAHGGGTACSPETCYDAKYCADGIDNDNDGFIDSKDPGCGGTAGAYCGDHVCSGYESAASCPTDCGGGTFTCNNNKICEANENYTSCPGDCGGTTTQKCMQTTEATCNADTVCKWVSGFGCGSKAQCNDSIDNDTDALIDYPKDPGCIDNFDDSEGTTAGAYCGDKSCSGSETAVSCPTDCGNGTFTCNNNKICEANENYTSCPGDCGGTGGGGGSCSSIASESSCKATSGCQWNIPQASVASPYCSMVYAGDSTSCPGFAYSNYDSTGARYCRLNTTVACEFFYPAYLDIKNYSFTECPSTTTSPTGVPSPGPTGLTFALGGTSVVFNWTDNSFEESNQLEERMTGSTAWTIATSIGGVGGTGSITYPNRPSGTYDYQVKACNSKGCSTPSNMVMVTYGGGTTTTTTTKPQCSDGKDNDGDAMIDYPSDTGCYSADDNDETMPTTTTCSPETCYDATYCSDGKDNDSDGYIDMADPGCGGTTTTTCSTPATCFDSAKCASSGWYWYNSGCWSSPQSTATSCGDHVCSGSETSATCPADCGTTCASGYYWDTATQMCQASSTTTTSTCNNNGICDGSETTAMCPTDCPSGTTTTTTTCPSGQVWDEATHMCKSSTTSASLFTPFLKLFGF